MLMAQSATCSHSLHSSGICVGMIVKYQERIYLISGSQNGFIWLLFGVPQGCTGSTMVFDVDFQIILDLHKWLVKGLNPLQDTRCRVLKSASLTQLMLMML